jgi:ubiquinone/menaquinone biosynthesis C-methylase UbiE
MQYYNKIANGYEELYGEEQQKKMNLILEHVTAKKSDLLLDVGCGTGLTTKVWNCRTIGLDPALQLLKRACGSQYINAEAEHIPFKDRSFDIVISITALQNFHDIKKGLEQIKRVGKERFILSFLKKSENAEMIQNLIEQQFPVHRILVEERDIIYII